MSPDLVSTITDAVLETVAEWQNRPLEAMYPIVFFDALRVKIRDEGLVRNKAVYIALGVSPDGSKDILGLWIETSEGAKFWLKVMNELKNRGVDDILIAVVDGLKGFPDAINAVFPATVVQTCIVHLIRHSMDFASWKDRKVLPSDQPAKTASSTWRRSSGLCHSAGRLPQARLTMLYRSTDCRCRRGAPVMNLPHSASFHSREKFAPSNPGIKQLGVFCQPTTPALPFSLPFASEPITPFCSRSAPNHPVDLGQP